MKHRPTPGISERGTYIHHADFSTKQAALTYAAKYADRMATRVSGPDGDTHL